MFEYPEWYTPREIFDCNGNIVEPVWVLCNPCNYWFLSQAKAGGNTTCKFCGGTVSVPKDARGPK